MKTEIGVGLIGFGTVGTGVARVLIENAELIRRRVGVPIKLVRIADLDITRDRGIVDSAGSSDHGYPAGLDGSTSGYRHRIDGRV